VCYFHRVLLHVHEWEYWFAVRWLGGLLGKPYIFFIRYHRWPYIPINFFLEENVQNSQNLTFPDISSHSLFLENYLFVQIPSSKFDHLPNSVSTPKTHKTIAKYNMEKSGTCRKFSRYPRENGAKFLREFESVSTLH